MEYQDKTLTDLLASYASEIDALKKENKQQENQLRAITETLHVLSDSIMEVAGSVDENAKVTTGLSNSFKDLSTVLRRLHCHVNNIKYELCDPRVSKTNYYYPTILDSSVAIDEIIQNHKSLARFGDGEFALMANQERHSFQHRDSKLAQRLYEALHSTDPNLLVAIADNYGSLDCYNKSGALGIRIYMTEEVRQAHQMLLEPDRVYYNAYLSRPYVLYKDNDTDAPAKRFQHLQKIWQDRDVIFVEGSQTRLGVGNNLFENTRSIKRIIAPPTSSFDRYDDILAASLQYAGPETLFLLALGPCAGVLAADLCSFGYQAVDIGHVDLEYEWFLQGTGERCAVPHKYNNEFYHGEIVEEIHDSVYESQILCSFA